MRFRSSWPVGVAIVMATSVGTLAAEPPHDQQAELRRDAYGDPLPPHAVLRLGTTRLHHQSSVQDAAFSPDGRLLASAAVNYAGISLWELPNGRLLRRLTVPPKEGDEAWTNALAFSPDGNKLLTADVRGTLHLWDVRTGEEIYAIEAHSVREGATAVAFSADGQWFASGGGDGVVRVWSAAQGHELLSFDTLPQPLERFGAMAWSGVFPAGSIAALSFSPDGKFLAAGIAESSFRSRTTKIQVWDLDANQPARSIGESSGLLSSLVFTPDGKHLISGENVTMPREKLGKPYPSLHAQVVKLRMWDAQTGELVRDIATADKTPGLGALALSADGRKLAAGYEGKIVIWDLATSTVRCSVDVPHWRGGRGLAISPDGQVVCAPLENTLGLWSTATGESLLAEVPSHTTYVTGVSHLTGGNSIVTIGGDTVRVWSAATGQQTWSRRFGAEAYVNALAVSPDGALLAAGGRTDHGETAVRIYHSATGEERHVIPMSRKKWYVNQVRAMAFAPDGQTLAVVRDRPKESNTYDLDIFDVATGERLKEIACGFFAGVRPVAFTKDGGALYTIGHQDAVVNLWDATTGAPRRLFTAIKPAAEAPGGKPRKPYVSDAAFAPDLKTLVTSQGRELIVWDIARGEAIAALSSGATEHGGNIALSLDGRWLAMTDLNYAGDPGSDAVRLFDMNSRRMVATLDSGQGRPSSFAFSPDGSRLVTGMNDGTTLVWDLAAAASKGQPEVSEQGEE